MKLADGLCFSIPTPCTDIFFAKKFLLFAKVKNAAFSHILVQIQTKFAKSCCKCSTSGLLLTFSAKNGNSIKWKEIWEIWNANLENGIPFYRERTVLWVLRKFVCAAGYKGTFRFKKYFWFSKISCLRRLIFKIFALAASYKSIFALKILLIFKFFAPAADYKGTFASKNTSDFQSFRVCGGL